MYGPFQLHELVIEPFFIPEIIVQDVQTPHDSHTVLPGGNELHQSRHKLGKVLKTAYEGVYNIENIDIHLFPLL